MRKINLNGQSKIKKNNKNMFNFVLNQDNLYTQFGILPIRIIFNKFYYNKIEYLICKISHIHQVENKMKSANRLSLNYLTERQGKVKLHDPEKFEESALTHFLHNFNNEIGYNDSFCATHFGLLGF